MGTARQLWEAWRRSTRVIGRFNTLLLLTVIYIVVLPVFALWRLRDPLALRRPTPARADDQRSYWRERPSADQSLDLERYTHPY